MENNAYIDFAYNYYMLLEDIYSKGYKSQRIDGFQRKAAIDHPIMQKSIVNNAIDESKKIEGELSISYVLDKYRRTSHIWNLDVPFSEWILYVKDYIEFIRWAEKCFLYRNESSIDREKSNYALYCEDKENTLYIRYFPNDVKVMINFTKS